MWVLKGRRIYRKICVFYKKLRLFLLVFKHFRKKSCQFEQISLLEMYEYFAIEKKQEKMSWEVEGQLTTKRYYVSKGFCESP